MNLRLLLVAVVLSGCPIVVPQPAREANDACAVFLSQGDYAQAEAACDHSLEYQPRYWDALHNKGLIALARNDRASAKKFFIMALRANQDMKVTYNDLGALEVDDQEFSSAIDHFKAALRVDPKYLEARRNLGVAQLKQHDCVEAEKTFRQLLLIDGRNADGLLGFATALECQKKIPEAIEACERATRFNVEDTAAWLCLGKLKTAQGFPEQAREAYERCLLADEKNLECAEALRTSSDLR